jgi:hypothetical protein
MKMRSRFALARFAFESLIVALLVATAAGCASPSSTKGTSGSGGATSTTGGHSGGGGTTGAGGASATGAGGGSATGAGGGSATGSGGSSVTGSGGSSVTGAGGSSVTGAGGSSVTGAGGTSVTGAGGTSATGAGGTSATGAGGTSVTGSGGAGGAALVVQKVCATKTKLTSPVFLNFESYDGTVTAVNYATAFGGAAPNTGSAYTGFYSYPEVMDGPLPPLAILAGHPPSNWAGSESFTATVWGMGGGIWMGCADASDYKGISFWVRGTSGTGTFSFSVSTDKTLLPDATNAAGGGTCPGTKETCVGPSKANIPITSDWTQVQILWSDFAAGTSGTASVIANGDNIAGFGWTVPLMFQRDNSVAADAAGAYVGVPEALRFDIDDISFVP